MTEYRQIDVRVAFFLTLLLLLQVACHSEQSVATNHPPQPASGSDSLQITAGTQNRLDLNGLFFDVDGDSLTFAILSAPEWVAIEEPTTLLLSPAHDQYLRDPVTVEIAATDGQSEISHTWAVTSRAAYLGTSTYGSARNLSNRIGAVIVEDGADPEVWLDGVQVTHDDWLQFDLAITESHAAWSETRLSNSHATIALDGHFIPQSAGFNFSASFTAERLLWLNYDANQDVFSVESYELLDKTAGPVLRLDFVAERLVVDSDQTVAVSGYSPTADMYKVTLVDPATMEISHEFASPFASTIILDKQNQLRLVRAVGSGNLATVFWAYYRLYSSQYGEPFASGGDQLGRLGNNQAERLIALAHLYSGLRDPDLLPLINGAAARVVETADPNGLYFSTKYSTSRQNPIAFAVDVMAIHEALLLLSPFVDEQLRQQILENARSALEHYEADFDGQLYRFPSCIDFQQDGLPLPWNQQAKIANVAYLLWSIDGTSDLPHRALAIAEALAKELEIIDNVRIWHYWPAFYYFGWPSGQFASCNSPTKESSTDPYFEDIYHALATLDLFEYLNKGVGIDFDISPSRISESIRIAPRQYSRFISGWTDGHSGQYRYLPLGLLADTPAIRTAFQRHVILPFADFDGQLIFQSYARIAASDLHSGVDNLVIEDYIVSQGDLLANEILELEADGSTCANKTREEPGDCLSGIKQFILDRIRTPSLDDLAEAIDEQPD